MSKTSIALLLIFLAILGVLITLNVMNTTQHNLKALPKLFPTKTVVSENTLSISPNVLNVSGGKASTFQILIDSKGEKPTLIQMELAYDPSAISSVTITPGDFYQNPNILLKKVNKNNGRISYAISPLAGSEDQTGSQVVATVKIIPSQTATRRESELTFLPKTIIQTEKSQSTLKNAYGAKIRIVSGIEPATPSAGVIPL